MQQPIEELKSQIKVGCFIRMNGYSPCHPSNNRSYSGDETFEVVCTTHKNGQLKVVFINNHGILIQRFVDEDDCEINEKYLCLNGNWNEFSAIKCIVGSLADLNSDHLDHCPCNTCEKYKGKRK